MKNSIVISTVVAAGLMAGAVMAPAQAEEDLREVGPCVDFYTEFGANNEPNIDAEKDGAAWSGTLEWLNTPEKIELPYLKVAPNYPKNEADKCQSNLLTLLDTEWVEKSDGWSSILLNEGHAYIGEDDDGKESFYMFFNEDRPAYFQVWPKLDVNNFGVYTNINNISAIAPQGFSGYKETQVSYTLTVLPPSTGNDRPEVPNESAGISDGYDFGNVEIFDYKRGVAEITNIGTEALLIERAKTVDSNGDEAPEFSVTGTDCIGRVIPPGRKCQVQVQFFPRVEGSRAAFIEVTDNSPYPLQIPLTGVGTYTKPDSIIEEEEEAAQGGTKPDYEVAEPEKPTVPDNQGQEATKKKGKWVVKTKKKKINVKWKAPDTDQPVTGYEVRKKYKKEPWKKKKWKEVDWGKWKDVDPMPNKNGWIKASVKAKKDGKYKVQIAASTPWVERGDKVTVKIIKKKK